MIEVAEVYECPTCLLDSDEPYCWLCGLDLSHNNKGPAEQPVEGRAQPGEEVRV